MSTIFLVDDHPVMRRGYISVLDRDPQLQVCGEAGSGEEALEKLEHVTADVVIVDISLTGMSGIELTRRIRANGWEHLILVISMHDESLFVKRALDAGAQGYMVKDEGATSLVKAVKRVLNGEKYLSKSLQHVVQ